MSKSVLPVLSSRSFMVSGLTVRPLIHFEFTFVYGIRECSNFILLYVALQFSQHHLLKRLSFLHCMFSPPNGKGRSKSITVCKRHDTIYIENLKMPPENYQSSSIHLVKLQDTKLIYRNLLHFCTLVTNYQKKRN